MADKTVLYGSTFDVERNKKTLTVGWDLFKRVKEGSGRVKGVDKFPYIPVTKEVLPDVITWLGEDDVAGVLQQNLNTMCQGFIDTVFDEVSKLNLPEGTSEWKNKCIELLQKYIKELTVRVDTITSMNAQIEALSAEMDDIAFKINAANEKGDMGEVIKLITRNQEISKNKGKLREAIATKKQSRSKDDEEDDSSKPTEVVTAKA